MPKRTPFDILHELTVEACALLPTDAPDADGERCLWELFRQKEKIFPLPRSEVSSIIRMIGIQRLRSVYPEEPVNEGEIETTFKCWEDNWRRWELSQMMARKRLGLNCCFDHSDEMHKLVSPLMQKIFEKEVAKLDTKSVHLHLRKLKRNRFVHNTKR